MTTAIDSKVLACLVDGKNMNAQLPFDGLLWNGLSPSASYSSDPGESFEIRAYCYRQANGKVAVRFERPTSRGSRWLTVLDQLPMPGQDPVGPAVVQAAVEYVRLAVACGAKLDDSALKETAKRAERFGFIGFDGIEPADWLPIDADTGERL